MKIKFTKSRWEYSDVPFETYLDRVSSDGFDGAEVFLLPERIDSTRVLEGTQKRNLIFIAQVINQGKTTDDFLKSFDTQVASARAAGAAFANCHTGSDFLSFEQNLRIFRHAAELSEAHGIELYHETHRGRALYNVPDTLRYLEALPDLKITADFSHFMCVHESELQDQEELLDQIIAQTRHIHARVGFPEGPQVAHPFAPEWSGLLERYLNLWKKMLSALEQTGAPYTCITPEAGPSPYMPTVPFTKQPLADAWSVNLEMKNWLKTKI